MGALGKRDRAQLDWYESLKDSEMAHELVLHWNTLLFKQIAVGCRTVNGRAQTRLISLFVSEYSALHIFSRLNLPETLPMHQPTLFYEL